MRWLRARLDRIAPHFERGGRLHKLHPLWEAADTFFYAPGSVTGTAAHVRDAIDLKRIMMTVVIAALPCVLMAIFNTGLQANLAIDPAKAGALEGWRHEVIRWLGTGYSPGSAVANGVHGALYFLPLYIVTMVVGLSWEVLFAIVRKVEVNEGFFVTGILFPLILPPTTPLWQAALGISFGVVLAKEVFGGTGMNFINPALAARAFLFFAYPADISGDKVWTAVQAGAAVDGFSGATLLGQMRVMTQPFEAAGFSWSRAFFGFEPGSMGETSAFACLIGAAIIAFNHLGHLDPLLVSAFSPRAPEFIALADLLQVPGTGLALRAYGVILIHREEHHAGAARDRERAGRAALRRSRSTNRRSLERDQAVPDLGCAVGIARCVEGAGWFAGHARFQRRHQSQRQHAYRAGEHGRLFLQRRPERHRQSREDERWHVAHGWERSQHLLRLHTL